MSLFLVPFQLFERIMQEKPEVMRKIMVVSGEITEPNLGLSEPHLQHVIDHTNILFHVAASVRFNAPLRANVLTNLVATHEAVEIAKRVKNLMAMLHVSTAFCTVELTDIEEKVYDAAGDPASLISLARQMDEEAMSSLEDQMLPPHPNTYTYTKRLAEILVQDEFRKSNMPLCIVRPSIVGPALREPLEGWVDSLSAMSGIVFGVAKGLLRCVLVDTDTNFDYIAVDQAINGFIMIAKQIATAPKR
jgi:fatty acyl-CoA reductase